MMLPFYNSQLTEALSFWKNSKDSNSVGSAGDSKVPFSKRVKTRRTKKKDARKARRRNKS